MRFLQRTCRKKEKCVRGSQKAGWAGCLLMESNKGQRLFLPVCDSQTMGQLPSTPQTHWQASHLGPHLTTDKTNSYSTPLPRLHCQAAHRCWKADGSAVSQPWGFFLLSAAPHYDECCRCKLHYTSMSASSHLEQPRLRYPWHFPCFQTPSSSSSLLSKRLDMMQVHIFSIRGCADGIFYLFI